MQERTVKRTLQIFVWKGVFCPHSGYMPGTHCYMYVYGANHPKLQRW